MLSGLPLTAHFITAGAAMLFVSVTFYSNTYYSLQQTQQQKKIFVLPGKHLMIFALIAFASMACENVMYDWSGIYFRKAVGSSKETATAAFVLYMVCMTVARFMGDKIVTRLGNVTILKYSGMLICSGLLLSSLFPYIIPAAVGFALIGFGVSCIVPMVFSLAGKSTTMSSSSAIASVSTLSYLGFLVIPPGVGFVAQAIGLRWSFGIMALFGAAVVLLVTMIKQHE